MVVASALMVGAFCFPAPAVADVRIANGLNRNQNDRGSSDRPVLEGLSARYDTAGDLTLTVSFFEPLGDPTALAGWEVGIYLADNVGTDRTPLCVPLLSRDNFLITFSLGDDLPAGAIQYGGTQYNIHKTVSPDRRSVRLRGADPSIANLNLICANADLDGPERTAEQYSFIGASLFSGFGALNGNLATTGRWHLAGEVAALNNRLGRARRDPPLGAFPRCRRTGRTEVRCAGRSRLRDVTGRPTIALHGRMRVSYTGDLWTRWRRDMRATLSWRRCPASVNPVRTGRRCSLTRRWRRGPLTRVFGSPRDSRASGAKAREELRTPSSSSPSRASMNTRIFERLGSATTFAQRR